jgi:hypothetical protein
VAGESAFCDLVSDLPDLCAPLPEAPVFLAVLLDRVAMATDIPSV